MASATPDLRLPSRSSVVTAHLTGTIEHMCEQLAEDSKRGDRGVKVEVIEICESNILTTSEVSTVRKTEYSSLFVSL